MTIATTLTAWKRRRMQAKLERHEHHADYYRAEATRLALEAYAVPDMMVTPMRWARLQNASNWAKHHERQHREEAKRIRVELLIGALTP